MYIDVIQSTLIDMAKRFEASSGLQPGKTLQGMVEGQAGKLVLNAGGTRVPLPTNSTLQPGTAVSVEVQQNDQGIQLRVTPQTTPVNSNTSQAPSGATLSGAASSASASSAAASLAAASASATSATLVSASLSAPAATPAAAAAATTQFSSPLAQLTATVLETLTGLRTPDPTLLAAAQQLPPTLLPATNSVGVNAALRAVLGLFANRQAVGEDLQQIVTLLSQATEADVPLANPQSATLLRQFTASTPEDFVQLLQRLSDVLAKPAEAHLGQVAQSTPTTTQSAASPQSNKLPENVQQLLQTDLRSQVAQLRDDPGLTRFLRDTGQLQNFQDATTRILDRVSGAQIQNLRGLEQPYLFMELPMTKDAPIQHGQIHVFSDSRGTGHNAIDPKQASVVLDLSTTRLGDLWIHLQTSQGICRCSFRATQQETVTAIQGTASELVENLQSAGYGATQVQATLWDGNRLREAADLMRRFSGFSANA